MNTSVIMQYVRNSRSRSSEDIDFGNSRNRMYDFLLAININLGPILRAFTCVG